jgi:DNA-directed RNA polymerase specialized sigma24 family protein
MNEPNARKEAIPSEGTRTRASRTEAGFENTHWTMVLDAARQQSSAGLEALEQLCKTYWPPLYAFLRGQGRSRADAQDLTQGFLVHLLAKDRLHDVHPAKGKFRSFLLACLENYVRNEADKERAEKRGGGTIYLPIDASGAEEEYGAQLPDPQDPARLFERRWASTLISEVLRRLKQKYAQSGKAELFDTLYPFLTGDAERGEYAPAAVRLQMNHGAVRAAVSRLRDDYRELLRAEVGRTVSNPTEVEEEIRHLFSLFQRG